MKAKRKGRCILLAFGLVVACIFTSAYTFRNDRCIENDDVDDVVELLYEQKAELLSQLFSSSCDDSMRSVIQEEIREINSELEDEGVEFLSDEEVSELLQRGALFDEEGNRVSIPSSSVNTWTSTRQSYSLNGVTYNIQRLTAQPSDPSSPLLVSSSRIVTFNTNWQVGVQNAVKSITESLAGEILPYGSIIFTVYDAISEFLSGISNTTEVSVPHIVYSWTNVTTATFSYVRLSSQTDDDQALSLISTRTNTAVGYQFPSFSYKNVSGSWVIYPDIENGKRHFAGVPTGHNYASVAVNAYIVGGPPVYRAISEIRISGPESKTVQNISGFLPPFPIACE